MLDTRVRKAPNLCNTTATTASHQRSNPNLKNSFWTFSYSMTKSLADLNYSEITSNNRHLDLVTTNKLYHSQVLPVFWTTDDFLRFIENSSVSLIVSKFHKEDLICQGKLVMIQQNKMRGFLHLRKAQAQSPRS